MTAGDDSWNYVYPLPAVGATPRARSKLEPSVTGPAIPLIITAEGWAPIPPSAGAHASPKLGSRLSSGSAELSSSAFWAISWHAGVGHQTGNNSLGEHPLRWI